MFESVDPVFAWAIGKALLIVIVSFGVLVYAAYAVTWPNKRPPLMLESPQAGIELCRLIVSFRAIVKTHRGGDSSQ